MRMKIYSIVATDCDSPLYLWCKIFGFTLLERKDEYSFLYEEMKEFKLQFICCSVKISSGESNVKIIQFVTNESEFESPTNNFKIYCLQRLLYGKKCFSLTRKRLEFETLFNLVKKNNENYSFIPQKNILNYYADCLFVLKSKLYEKFPSIVLEIDEDGHRDRDEENEIKRQRVIEAFNYNVIRINVPRGSSIQDIESISLECHEKLRMMFSDIMLEYNKDISFERILKISNGCGIDNYLSDLLFDNKTNKFFCNHEDIGDYLGYSRFKKDGYKHFVILIKAHLEENIDYKLVIGPSDISKKNQNGGRNKKTYLLSRMGVYLVCFYSRKPKAIETRRKILMLYENIVDFINDIRIKNLQSLSNRNDKLIEVNSRIDLLNDRKKDKQTIQKLIKRVQELEKIIEEKDTIINKLK